MHRKNKKDTSYIRRSPKRPSKCETEHVALALAELIYAVFMEEQEVKERQQWPDKVSQ